MDPLSGTGESVVNDLVNTLFATGADSVAADYLAFLAKRVPKDLAQQLDLDGQPDISMPSSKISAEDLVEPLSTGAFPTTKLWEMVNILGYILIGYSNEEGEKEAGIRPPSQGKETDPFKMVYAASLYLYCFIRNEAGPGATGYSYVLRVLATGSSRLDVQSRLQVARFLFSLVPMLPPNASDDPAPLSGFLLTISLVVASVFHDLAVYAEQAMQAENFAQEWKNWHGELVESEKEMTEFMNLIHGDRAPVRSDVHPIEALNAMWSDFYGRTGKMRQDADRLLRGIQGEKRGELGFE